MPIFVTRQLARWSLAVVYVWFGVLKLFDASPANPLVSDLIERTLPMINFTLFIATLGIFEMLIGLLFLVPRYQKVLVPLFILHVILTAAPLVLLPAVTWRGLGQPTLEGQYILKNLAIIALALTIFTDRQR